MFRNVKKDFMRIKIPNNASLVLKGVQLVLGIR